MTTVIQLNAPHRIPPRETRLSSLLALFAQGRRGGDDVFWLKENAELLNVLECTGQDVPLEALAVHAGFYRDAAERLRFFPQYYRFFLSMVLDLEDLGVPGDTAEAMVAFADRMGLPGAELSDLQRAEARRLMRRRGVDPIREPGLNDRLRAFASRNATFALPNKKAAYELTHIVFYLTEYGRRPADLPAEAIRSLHFAGLTAFLEQNADLLAEICIALVWAGDAAPVLWTDWLEEQTASFGLTTAPDVSVADDYHEFLVCNWHAAVSGRPVFRKPIAAERTRFDRAPRLAPLSEISRAMMTLDTARSGDWSVMRDRMQPSLSPATCDLMEAAARSSEHFDAFFEGFARAGRP
ncbi:DUF6902 family protein [Citreimonas sp.]|uniref:DUF6902 family protein n=1 Tax=Citreimonas sp. TaxID=3036715 RepID=UPI0040594982